MSDFSNWRSPETWLPTDGLSRMECIQASATMARFCILINADPEKSEAERNEAKAIFAWTADLSCKDTSELENVINADLTNAGLNEETAREWAGELSAPEYLEEVASCTFLVTHKPKFGLIKRPKAKYFDNHKLVRSLVKLGSS